MTLLKLIIIAALAPMLLAMFFHGVAALLAAFLLTILAAGAIAGLVGGLTAGLVLRRWLRRLMVPRRL